jgi:mannitol/fructose-specific phosphotransferase system IIA component (Ntr-type)
MKLLGFLDGESIIMDLEATDKEGVVRELVILLQEKNRIEDGKLDAIVDAILKRESMGSTGIGNGLAIPHVKASPLVEELVGAFGRSVEGVDFGALDGEPVHLFFLMVSPKDGVEEHLDILKKIASLGRDEHFCQFLTEARNKQEIVGLLEEVSER